MKLNRRERLVVGLGGLVVVILGVWLLVVAPLADRAENLERLTVRLEKDLAEMKALAEEYEAEAAGRDRMQQQVQARGSDFSPFTYLEGLAREADLTGSIESMTPVTANVDEESRRLDQVDVRFSGIGISRLVRFLYRLESSDKVFFVVNLNIRPRYLTPEVLDVSMRLASPRAG